MGNTTTTITVSYDSKSGQLNCTEPTAAVGATIQWVPDGTTVSSIQSVSISTGTFTTAPTSGNSWTGVLGSDSRMGNGTEFGWQYTIQANTVGGAGLKQKSPKIALSTTNPKPVH